MENKLQIFKNELFGEVRIIMLDEKPYFIANDVLKALGYAEGSWSTTLKRKCKGVTKCKGLEYRGNLLNLIPEGDVYRLIFGSELEEAEKFESWVMDELLPQLRRTGVYMTEAATPEAISYEALYGVRRIKNTFRDTQDINQEYKRYKEMAKEQNRLSKLTNKQRIIDCNKILEVIQERLIDNQDTFTDMLVLIGLREQINKDMRELDNRRNGGIKSAKTKQINKLESEKEELQEKIITLEQCLNDNDEYFFIDRHPFTVNCMYLHDVKTPAYHRWINNLHLEEFLPKEYPGLDITKPMAVKLLYGHKEFGSNGQPFDLVNFNKAIIDQIASFYNFNDSLIKKHSEETHKYVNSYEEGYIYVSLRNLTQEEIDFLYNNDDEE